jgi:hypothetical protein
LSIDYLVLASVATVVASVLVMASLLSRYSHLVKEADKSSRLAKDVWDSMNSRFAVVDARVIELMAKTDILSSRVSIEKVQAPGQQQSIPNPPPPSPSSNSSGSSSTGSRLSAPVFISQGELQRTPSENTDTEVKVLRLLVDGPKSSAEIKALVGRSREHTARMMKDLFERGLVVRNDRSKPYVYEITDRGRSYVAN